MPGKHNITWVREGKEGKVNDKQQNLLKCASFIINVIRICFAGITVVKVPLC